MDRTADFFGTVQVLRTHGGVAPSALAQLAGVARLPPPSPLEQASKAIARALKITGRRVMRLYRLAHRKGLFDDPAAEINELTAIIKAEIEGLDRQMRLLSEEIARQHGLAPPPGGPAPRPGPQGHWTAVTDALRANLAGVTRTFQDALQLRGETMREQAARRQQFASSSWAPSRAALPLDSPLFAAPPVAPTGPGMQQAGPGRPGAPTPPGSIGTGSSMGASSGGVAVPSPGRAGAGGMGIGPPGSSGSGTGGGGYMQQQPSGAGGAAGGSAAALRRRPQALQHPHPYQPSAHSSSSLPAPAAYGLSSAHSLTMLQDARAGAQAMAGVEATIVELGPLFTRMAGLVAEQGETLARIDADIDEAGENVEAGASELGKYLRSVQTHRGFLLKLFAVLAFVILLLGIFR